MQVIISPQARGRSKGGHGPTKMAMLAIGTIVLRNFSHEKVNYGTPKPSSRSAPASG